MLEVDAKHGLIYYCSKDNAHPAITGHDMLSAAYIMDVRSCKWLPLAFV